MFNAPEGRLQGVLSPDVGRRCVHHQCSRAAPLSEPHESERL